MPRPRPAPPPRETAAPEAGRVLTTALFRAADIAGLSRRALARTIGVSEATLSRAAHGRPLDPESKEGELALVFLRGFRSLDALVGGNPEQVRAFLHAPNRHLGGVPADLVQSAAGLFHVVEYLDAVRGRG